MRRKKTPEAAQTPPSPALLEALNELSQTLDDAAPHAAEAGLAAERAPPDAVAAGELLAIVRVLAHYAAVLLTRVEDIALRLKPVEEPRAAPAPARVPRRPRQHFNDVEDEDD